MEGKSKFNLSKGEGDTNDKSRFNLSKSPDSGTAVAGETIQTPADQPGKRKTSKIILLSLLGLVCLAVILWAVTKNKKSAEQIAASTEQSVNKADTPYGAGSPQTASETGSNAVTPKEAAGQVQTAPAQTAADLPYRKNEYYKVYQFPYNASACTQPGKELDDLAAVMKQNPSLTISITAYTDNVGSAEYNLVLSDLRAKSIRDYLVSQGIDARRMKYEGKGISTKYPNQAENRRAEFVLTE